MPYALALDAAVAFLKRYKVFLLVGPLLLALALSHCSDKRHTRQRDEARAENAAILKASEANRAAAIAQAKTRDAQYTNAVEENKRVEANLRDRLGALAAANADRMRADKVCRSYAPAVAQGETASVDNGPGPDAIVLGRADYDILVGNTVRLQAARDWAISLVNEGLAVPSQGQ